MSESEDLRRVAEGMRTACLATCVRQINRRVTRIYDAALRPYGVGTAQLNILTALALAGEHGAQQSKIAKALDLEKSTLSRNLDRMIERRWIITDGAAQGGARIRLSALGNRVMKRALPGWQLAQQRASTEVHAALVDAMTRAARASDPSRSLEL
jgi:DNA-binding MarR family transcriptional regulator